MYKHYQTAMQAGQERFFLPRLRGSRSLFFASFVNFVVHNSFIYRGHCGLCGLCGEAPLILRVLRALRGSSSFILRFSMNFVVQALLFFVVNHFPALSA